MAHSFPTAEGFIEYTPYTAGKPCRTWYKVHGDLKLGVRPLVIVHGGPGLSHDYMLSLTDLACPPYNIPLVFYDQIGCGQSTHLPDKNRDYGFWTEQLFLDQLTTVLRHFGIEDDYDLLGHSWGGMLASTHTARQPLGLKNLVLASTPVSGQAWMNAYKRYREMMPENYKEELMRPREFDLPDTPEYQEAIHAFLVKHFCSLNPMPEECLRSFQHAGEDPTVVLSTMGPSQFDWVGLTMTWSVANELHKNKVPTLIINGVNEGADEESQKTMAAGVKDSKSTKFKDSRHMLHWEERDRFMKTVGEWLKE